MSHEIETKIEIERNFQLLIWSLMLVIFALFLFGMYLRNHEVERQLHHIYLNEFEYPKCDTLHMDRASTYYPSLEQCASRDSLGNIDSSSNIYNTADGSFINMEKLRKKELQWVALPKSMIVEYGGSPFHFGDSILFYSKKKPQINGKWVLHDVVSGKWGATVDFLVHPDNNKPKLGIGKDVKIIIKKKNQYETNNIK